MAKQWTPIIHREYTNSLRQVVSDHDRYSLGSAIWDRVIATEDPTAGATPVPHRTGRFTLALLGYIITCEVAVDAAGKILADAREIKFLPITKIV